MATVEETKKMIKVMQAYVDGKEIELWDNPRWVNGDCHISWKWGSYNYRVKPEPRKIWVNEYIGGGIGHHKSQEEANMLATEKRIKCTCYQEVIED